MKNDIYQVIRRPIITEKGLGVKETHGPWFRSREGRDEDGDQGSRTKIFKVKVEDVRTAIYHGKLRRRGRSEGHRRDWKKAYVKLGANEKMIEYAENL